jgi:hypothetical protein
MSARYAVLALLLGAFLSVTGCSPAQQANLNALNASVGSQSDPASFSKFIDAIKAISKQDLATAMADVHAKGDQDLAALQCYPAISEFLDNPAIKVEMPTIDGAISINQLKRDIFLGISSGNSPVKMALRRLHTACAAYVSDEKRFAAEFTLVVGAASHGVPPVTGLPGVLAPILDAVKP